MKRSLSIKIDSFSEDVNLMVCSDLAASPTQTAWRAKAESRSCVLDANGHATGMVHVAFLQEYNVSTGALTGNETANVPSQSGYIPDYQDLTLCPIPPAVNPVNFTVFNNSGQVCHLVQSGAYNNDFYLADGNTLDQNFPDGSYTLRFILPDRGRTVGKYRITGADGLIVTGLDGVGYFASTCVITGITSSVSLTVEHIDFNGNDPVTP